jgi:phage-related protein (TIGR01555 family)
MRITAHFADGMANVVTGLGTGKDKSSFNQFVSTYRSKLEFDAAYRDNWIAKKVIDLVPFDMLRAWRAWQADEGQVELIEAAETALDLRTKIKAAMIRGRLYGGGAILIGTDDARPEDELIIDRLPKDGIKYLTVLSRYEIIASDIIKSPVSPYYGEPAFYSVKGLTGGEQVVHPSRVIRFLGAPSPDDSTSTSGWSESVLQSLFDALEHATSAAQHIASMLPEAKTEIVSIPDLSEQIATTVGEERLIKRMQVASLARSMFNTTLLSSANPATGNPGDTWQQKQLAFTGLPDVAKLFLQIASGAADIPATRLLGQSPAGMNATGDSDLRNYYDHISARQSVELAPAIRRLDRLLIRHALGVEPPGVWYNWNPLYQPSEKEKAEVGKIKAETVAAMVNTGTIPDEVMGEGVKGWLIGSDLFPGIEQAYDSHQGPLVEELPEPVNENGQGLIAAE